MSDLALSMRKHWRKELRQSSRVYFIEAIGLDVIKIGQSSCVAQRLVELQKCSPVILNLLCDTAGHRTNEFRLHRMFAQDRRHGEWFTASPRLRTLIGLVREHADLNVALAILEAA